MRRPPLSYGQWLRYPRLAPLDGPTARLPSSFRLPEPRLRSEDPDFEIFLLASQSVCLFWLARRSGPSKRKKALPLYYYDTIIKRHRDAFLLLFTWADLSVGFGHYLGVFYLAVASARLRRRRTREDPVRDGERLRMTLERHDFEPMPPCTYRADGRHGGKA